MAEEFWKNAVKKPLSQRWHICCGIEMQRDLYSAFLSAAVSRVIQSANGGKMVPASFGVGRRLSGSPVKPEATITEAVDAVIRINEDESHREVI